MTVIQNIEDEIMFYNSIQNHVWNSIPWVLFNKCNDYMNSFRCNL